MIVTRVCDNCGARKRVIETRTMVPNRTRCACGSYMGLVLFDSETDYEVGSLVRDAKRSESGQ